MSDKQAAAILALIFTFLKPQFVIWCWEYLQSDLGLPEPLSYWKMFWLMFAVSCFRPFYYQTKKEFYDQR